MGPLRHALSTTGYAAVTPAPDLEDLARAATRDTVLIAAFDHPAYAELTRIDDLCTELGLRWLPLRRERGRAVLGPAVVPGTTADFADVRDRRLSAARDPRIVEAIATAPQTNGPRTRPADARWIFGQLDAHLERWIADGTPVAETDLDPATFTQVSRTVLPVPTRPRPVVRGDAEADLLVDEQVGVVTGVQELAPLTGTPAALRVCAVDVADMRRVADWHNDRQAFGTSWGDFDTARRSAVGEAVERYCTSRAARRPAPVRQPRRPAPGRGTRTRPAPPPPVLASPVPHRGLPLRTVHRGLRVRLDRGPQLDHRRERVGRRRPSSPTTRPTRSATAIRWWPHAAAGVNEEHAVTSGLEEVIERDTTMVWWANAARLPRLPLTDRIRELVADSLDAYELTLIHLDNEFGIPVVAAVVRDRATGWLTIGFATRPDPRDAAEKALAEGFTLHHTCHYLDDGKVLAQGQADLPHLGNLKPYRADRRYLDSYREDFADVRDLLCQQQLHLDPR